MYCITYLLSTLYVSSVRRTTLKPTNLGFRVPYVWGGNVLKLCHQFVLMSPLQILKLRVTQIFCEGMAMAAAITFDQQIWPELYQDHKHMFKYIR